MAGINLGLNFLLIPRWGMWGAVLATLLSLLFKIVALYLVGRRYFKIPFEWGRMAVMLAIAGLLYFVRLSIGPESMFLALSWDAFLVLSFPVVLWVTGVINREEKESVRSLSKFIMGKAFNPGKM
jgi:O-antigen/teichoic acid export membrane protein